MIRIISRHEPPASRTLPPIKQKSEMEDAASPNSGSDLNLGGNRGRSIEECQDMIQRSFRNPIVKFLMEQMEKSGCRVGDNFVKAVVCTGPVAGGYTKGRGITVCSNYLTIQDEVNQVVIHELIHAYDECRAKNLDWTNCAHHACSEIRAGHLSGDCHFKRELLRGFIKLRGHEQECIKRRVLKSLRGNPYCSEVAAKDAMEAVWDTCYNDTKPFDRAP
ncbi:mitochondrial inner membrane protease ATP23 [Raphanus sativus]|uniref:Mitochondrial inner membrane protease ATP23 n=2 Tax=Brassiceae TaxID=981071 RepID=A0A6J0NT73_RAPSA|nr:mitochondrial inner membrane protease ATP23 [Raphanus sativus]